MRDSEIKAMIQALRDIEREEYLNLRGLARRLGFSVGQLSMILNGKRRPGIRFVRAVVERFPEVRQLLANSLSEPQEDGD
jgi:transcriptional regulator with XRE-family HTH domain